MRRKHINLLLVCIIISEAAGLIGSLASAPALSAWYAGIEKPLLNPPGWIFGPVWTLLFLLMGISLYLVIRHRRKIMLENKYFKPALWAFGAQWLLNVAWSFCFFYFENPGLAAIEIGALILSIVITIYLFYKVHRRAAYLLLPYLAWVLFAAYLNIMIWRLN